MGPPGNRTELTDLTIFVIVKVFSLPRVLFEVASNLINWECNYECLQHQNLLRKKLNGKSVMKMMNNTKNITAMNLLKNKVVNVSSSNWEASIWFSFFEINPMYQLLTSNNMEAEEGGQIFKVLILRETGKIGVSK